MRRMMMFGMPFPMPFIGKRDSEEMMPLNTTETFCRLSTETDRLLCEGEVFNFNCEIETKLPIQEFEHELEDLRILPTDFEELKNSTGIEKTMILSLKPEENVLNKFTLMHKNESMLLSIYHKADLDLEGFRVKDVECWRKFERMIETDKQAKISLTLAL